MGFGTRGQQSPAADSSAKRYVIGSCGSSNSECIKETLTGIRERITGERITGVSERINNLTSRNSSNLTSMGATSTTYYPYIMTATINSMTTTTITYTINSFVDKQTGRYSYDNGGPAYFTIQVSPNTYVISNLPDNFQIIPGVSGTPGMPFPQYTMPLKSQAPYTTTLINGNTYDFQINNPPDPAIIPTGAHATTTNISITSPKITLTIE